MECQAFRDKAQGLQVTNFLCGFLFTFWGIGDETQGLTLCYWAAFQPLKSLPWVAISPARASAAWWHLGLWGITKPRHHSLINGTFLGHELLSSVAVTLKAAHHWLTGTCYVRNHWPRRYIQVHSFTLVSPAERDNVDMWTSILFHGTMVINCDC